MKKLNKIIILIALLIIQTNVYGAYMDDLGKGSSPQTKFQVQDGPELYGDENIKEDGGRLYIGNSFEQIKGTVQQGALDPETVSGGIIYSLMEAQTDKESKEFATLSCKAIEKDKTTQQTGSNNSDSTNSSSSNKDGRNIVNNPQEWPWIVHGHLRIDYGGGCIYIGSGTLIHEYCVLTAAHNLLTIKEDGDRCIPKKITFFVGMKEGKAAAIKIGDQHKSAFPALKIAINDKYPGAWKAFNKYGNEEKEKKEKKETAEKELWASDFGLLYLDTNLGEYIGTAGFGHKDITKGHKITISGYPMVVGSNSIDRAHRSLYTMNGEVNEVSNDYAHYNVCTSSGQSGSGVYETLNNLEKDTPHCFAIHTYGPHKNGNIGTSITADNEKNIKEWIKYFLKKN